ncbi:DUF4440 domain-containing protein [Gaetbulibacter sp. M240]|uniref:YybH family protein n=1 Tax=Gaetbulibacter sp. M240 TaxID=3126511 RepID=UPI00374F0DDE
MKKIKYRSPVFLAILVALIFSTSCNQKSTEKNLGTKGTDLSILEKEIELRLREYENYLEAGDSIALGNMYTEDAEVIPTIVSRENIIKVFSKMIQNGTIGTFETTHLWGNDELLVEEGKAVWSHKSGGAESSGRYLLVWKKDDREWKILRDTWFPDKKK